MVHLDWGIKVEVEDDWVEWVELIKQAKEQGLNTADILEFIKSKEEEK